MGNQGIINGGVVMDNNYTGLTLAASSVIRNTWYPGVIAIFLGTILCVIGYLFICFIIPWISEVVCTLFYKAIIWGDLVGFH